MRDTSWNVSRFSLGSKKNKQKHGSHHPGGDNNGILGGFFSPNHSIHVDLCGDRMDWTYRNLLSGVFV